MLPKNSPAQSSTGWVSQTKKAKKPVKKNRKLYETTDVGFILLEAKAEKGTE